MATYLLVSLLFIAIPTPFLNSKFIFTSIAINTAHIIMSYTNLGSTVALETHDNSQLLGFLNLCSLVTETD